MLIYCFNTNLHEFSKFRRGAGKPCSRLVIKVKWPRVFGCGKGGLMARDGGKVGLTFYWGTLKNGGTRGKESGDPSLGAEVPRSCEKVRWLGGTSEPSTSFHYVAGTK